MWRSEQARAAVQGTAALIHGEQVPHGHHIMAQGKSPVLAQLLAVQAWEGVMKEHPGDLLEHWEVIIFTTVEGF